MLDKILDYIRSRSREDWQELVMGKWGNSRTWLQENGELAFLAGMILCFLMIIFFKFFTGLVAIVVLCSLVTYQIALPESEMEKSQSVETTQSSTEVKVEVLETAKDDSIGTTSS